MFRAVLPKSPHGPALIFAPVKMLGRPSTEAKTTIFSIDSA